MIHKRSGWIIGILWLCLCGTSPGKEEPFNVDVFFGWGGCYRPMEWTPVEINIQSNLTEPFEGVLSLSARQDELNTMNLVHPFVVTPELPQHIPLVTKLAFAADKCAVRIEGQRGRQFWNNTYNLWDFSGEDQLLTSLGVPDVLIGVIGQRRFGIIQMNRQAISITEEQRGRLFVQDKMPRTCPWDWTGYCSLDLLVLYDPTWGEFHPEQKRAICDWIGNGGALLLVLGTNPLPAGDPIAALLPVEPGTATNLSLTSDALADWDLDPAQDETIVGYPMAESKTNPLWQYQGKTESGYLFAMGPVGFGRVGVLAFDPGNLSDRQKTSASAFWIDRYNAVVGNEKETTVETDPERRTSRNQFESRGGGTYTRIPRSRRLQWVEDAEKASKDDMAIRMQRFETGYQQSAGNSVMGYLYNIAQMRPLSIWWVIGLLVLLAVLLGPVDYLVLKKLERQPLTWVTSAGWIALFTVGAYYGVQMLRGGSMQVRTVSVIDGIAGQIGGRGSYYTGIFAPRSADYPLDNPDQLRKRRQWWSGISPTQENIWSYQQQTAGRNLYCTQYDGANVPYSVPINIWTIQCLLNETAETHLPIEATLTRENGSDKLTISNRSEYKLTDGYVQLDPTHRMEFHAVGPGQTKEFVAERRTPQSWDAQVPQAISRYSGGNMSLTDVAAFSAPGSLARTQGMLRYLEQGAAVVCAKFENPKIPFSFRDRTYPEHHVQWVRQVIFPQP
jgi:hypothetical protein